MFDIKLIAFVTFVAIVGTKVSCNMEKAVALHDKCVTETGVSEELITNARKGDFANDPKFKCYLNCVMKNMGVMDENGQLNLSDEKLGIIPPENREYIRKMADECAPKIAALQLRDQCDMVYELNKCAYNFDPLHYIVI